MAFEHVRAGDRFAPKAFEFNAMLDAGRAMRAGEGLAKNEAVEILATGAGVIRVKNNTGGDLDRYACVSVGAAMWVMDRNSRVSGLVFVATAADPWQPIGIVQTPLKAGALGPAVIHGPSPVDVKSGGTSTHRWAIADASTAKLQAATGGQVRLLAEPPALGGVVLGIVGQLQNYWRYKLTGTMGSGDLGVGNATLFNLDNTTTGLSVQVINQHGIYTGQLSNDVGNCHEAAGKFYAEIAPCDA